MGAISQALLFVVQAFFHLYAIIVVLRLMLRSIQADYYHPLVQFVVKSTNKPVKCLKVMLPDTRSIELASLAWLFIVVAIKLLLVCLINSRMPNIVGLGIWAVGESFEQLFQVFTYIIIGSAIISWIPMRDDSIRHMLLAMARPLLSPFQRFIPPIGGLDLSPLFALLASQVTLMVLVNPVSNLGLQ